MIEIRDVTFSYHSGVPILRGLNFSLSHGDRVGICGPNGSGKTTMLQVIMGLLRAHEGELRIFGKQRSKEADFFEVRRKIGFLFQDPDDQLFCPTVKDDVAFGPLNLGLEVDEVEKVVDDTLETLGLEPLRERVIYRLSGGEKRLVSLATVMAMRPEAVLLDEPTAGLDEDTTLRLAGVLREHFKTYMIVSHDRAFLESTVDVLYRMEGGKIYRPEYR
ncbi:MAG: energy-coupling factor ABC transporter ATP-binding protein [Deltaproteobacteria bacterium]|nr:energy-coupling factor ABC transporter ATP-binding protein [Deltaproteobacteria bacterium]